MRIPVLPASREILIWKGKQSAKCAREGEENEELVPFPAGHKHWHSPELHLACQLLQGVPSKGTLSGILAMTVCANTVQKQFPANYPPFPIRIRKALLSALGTFQIPYKKDVWDALC